MIIARKDCADCGLSLPLKQFASYRGQRHCLCRTCLAIDTAEFKAWVLPYVEARRAEGEAPYHWEDWEIAVTHRLELSAVQRKALTLRSPRSMQPSGGGHGRKADRWRSPAVLRPWKYALAV